jgi:hypothetical protein
MCAFIVLPASESALASAHHGHTKTHARRRAKHHAHKKKHKKQKHVTTPAAKPTPTGTTNLLRGVTIGYGGTEAEIASEVAEAKALHAQVVRLNLSWAALQPEGPGEFAPGQVAAVDAVVKAAAAQGLKLVVLVQSSPCWASSAPSGIEATCVPGGLANEANAWPPSNAGYFGTFVAELARRYGSNLAAIEVWNEPDYAGENYLAGSDKAGEYAAILKAAYPAIKAVDPSIAVLAGSLVGSNGAFLRDLYADGIKGYYDGLAVHYYTLTISALRSVHQIQVENGDNTPIWLDEFGFPSCVAGQTEVAEQAEQACVTTAIQATDIANIVRSVVRLPYVASAILYKLRDTPGNEFGLLTASGARKPSFGALANAFASPFVRPSPLVLHLVPGSEGIAAYGSGPVGNVIQLEAIKDGKELYGATFTLNSSNTFSTHLPASLGRTGVTVRLYEVGTPPASGAQLSL